MDVLPISLEARPFQGLLNGLIKKNFYSDKDITTDFLQQELYAGIEELEAGQFTNEINLYEKILLKAAEQNWEQSRLNDFLTQRGLPADHVLVFNSIWVKEAVKINKKLMKDVTWNDCLERLSWRIDVRTLSKTVAEQNDEPIAFFELATKQNTRTAAPAAVVHSAKFEMDRSEVANMLASLSEIQQVFDGVQ